MKKNQSNIEAVKAKREQLKKLSNEALKKDRELYPEDEGQRANINTLLMVYIYNRHGNRTFNTFAQWLRLGYVVNKGEKAFLLWGQPKEGKRAEGSEEDNFKFFPLAYVFSDEQVYKIESTATPQEAEPEPTPEPEPEPQPVFTDEFDLF